MLRPSYSELTVRGTVAAFGKNVKLQIEWSRFFQDQDPFVLYSQNILHSLDNYILYSKVHTYNM